MIVSSKFKVSNKTAIDGKVFMKKGTLELLSPQLMLGFVPNGVAHAIDLLPTASQYSIR